MPLAAEAIPGLLRISLFLYQFPGLLDSLYPAPASVHLSYFVKQKQLIIIPLVDLCILAQGIGDHGHHPGTVIYSHPSYSVPYVRSRFLLNYFLRLLHAEHVFYRSRDIYFTDITFSD
jgi:hypothetical protein